MDYTPRILGLVLRIRGGSIAYKNSIMLRLSKCLLLACILASCAEELDVKLNELENKFSFNLEFINIEYARHHMDYGVVYVKLKESPSDSFWHDLEYKGWVKVNGSSEILYLRERYILEYRSEEKLVIIEPRFTLK